MAFNLLRWGHFFLFTLALIQGFLDNWKSPIKKVENPDDEDSVAEEVNMLLRVVHRDGTKKLFARVLATVSVFGYQGIVFYAQLALANGLIDCSGKTTIGTCTFSHIQGNRELWIMIDTLCFYCYMLANVIYIAWRMLWGSIRNADRDSDMAKALNDFIEYASINMTWFSMNFVLVAMPPLCIFFLNSEHLHKNEAENTQSYLPIMYTLWGMHVLHFVCSLRIYKWKELTSNDIGNVPDTPKAEDKDDHFVPTSINEAPREKKPTLLASESIRTIKFDEHYKPRERYFVVKFVAIWYLNLAVSLGAFIAYMFTDGIQLVFALYIPLDVLFNVCKTLFFLWYYFADKREKAEKERIADAMKKDPSKAKSIKTALLASADDDGAEESEDDAPTGAARFVQGTTSTSQAVKERELAVRKLKKDSKFLDEIVENEKKLGLGGDTYAMAFKAFNWGVIKELDLEMHEVHNSYHAAMFVFGIQVLMIVFIGTVVFSEGFVIVLPPNVSVMGARFICTILMHLQVEGDMRQGLRMMKYVTNQASDFSNPAAAFFVAIMQTLGGVAAELACILYLGSLGTAIDVIIKFVALASIAKVDDFYASALPADGNKIKKKTKPLIIRVHKRDWERQARLIEENPAWPGSDFVDGKRVGENANQDVLMDSKSRKLGRCIFKFWRILYGSFIFYFMPYLSVFLPYIASYMRMEEKTAA